MSDGAEIVAPLGIMGGTFNPVHFGHLRSAVEVRDGVGLGKVHLIPSGVPPHRDSPECSAEHRARMVSLAIEGEPGLVCDRRELRREGRSYTIDTLADLRTEIGPVRPLCLIVGDDAAASLDTWHRWRELLDYAHFVVIGRPGWMLPEQGPVAEYLTTRRIEKAEELRERPGGNVLVATFRQLSISSTEIRDLVAAGRSASYLAPRQVLDYIKRHSLYRPGVSGVN